MGEDAYLDSYWEDQVELSGPPADDTDCDPFGDDSNIEPSEDMDGDHASALASAGWGTEEDYGYFGDPEDFGWFGEAGCNEE